MKPKRAFFIYVSYAITDKPQAISTDSLGLWASNQLFYKYLPVVFYKKFFLKISQDSRENTFVRVPFK